jgi:probable addiction module antidote protein
MGKSRTTAKTRAKAKADVKEAKPDAEAKVEAKAKRKIKAEGKRKVGPGVKAQSRRAAKSLAAEIAARLRTDEDAALYLAAVLHEGNPLLVAAALRDVVRARGLAAVSRITGVGKGSLRRTLAAGKPALEAALDLMRALAPRR